MKTSSFVIAAVAVFAIAAAIDSDGDGVDDSEDVCPFMASSSSSQLNSDTDRDGDGVGNACDCQSLERSDAGYNLGELMKWNAIVFGDMLAYGSVTEGRLAVQGDVWAQNYGFAKYLDATDATEASVYVEGNMNAIDCQVWDGDCLVGKVQNNTERFAVTNGELSVVDETTVAPIDMEAVKTELQGLSSYLCGWEEEDYGKVFGVGDTERLFKAVNPRFAVFHVKAEDLNTITRLQFDVPETTTVILNVVGDGSDANWDSMDIVTDREDHVLINVCNVPEMWFGAVSSAPRGMAHIIMPDTRVHWSYGALDGHIAAKSLTQIPGELYATVMIRKGVFEGCICPVNENCGSNDDITGGNGALVLGGLLGVGVIGGAIAVVLCSGIYWRREIGATLLGSGEETSGRRGSTYVPPPSAASSAIDSDAPLGGGRAGRRKLGSVSTKA